jgi:hypothetical protein
MHSVDLEISGLGIILYSPPAVAHIVPGADYFEEHFWQPNAVAEHVMAGQLTAFGTGSPGRFELRFFVGAPDEWELQSATCKLRLGLQVHGGLICVRDVYDLMDWHPACPPSQQVPTADGWYRLTVYSSPPPSGIIGDGQVVCIYLEPVAGKPALRWEGVPSLC